MNYKITKMFDYNNQSVEKISVFSDNFNVEFMTLGASILTISLKSASGDYENILLGYDDVTDYKDTTEYYGMTIGRTSGRIANGSFSLNNQEYQLEKNGGEHHLHGGSNGVSFQLFDYAVEELEEKTVLTFTSHIKHLEDGYPGNIDITVRYVIQNSDITVEYFATADQDTLCNLTNHAYFNLSGNNKRTILEEELFLDCDCVVELDQSMIGKSVIPVSDTAYDFNVHKKIGEDINDKILHEHSASGYDHPFLFNKSADDQVKIELIDPLSKRKMKVYTDYPCVVIYTTNYPSSKLANNHANVLKHQAICFECQYVPNDINQALLKKDNTYHHFIKYEFSI